MAGNIDYTKMLTDAGIGAGLGGLGMGAASYFGGDANDPQRKSKAVQNGLLGAALGGTAGGAVGGMSDMMKSEPPKYSTGYDTFRGLTHNNWLNTLVGGGASTGYGMHKAKELGTVMKDLKLHEHPIDNHAYLDKQLDPSAAPGSVDPKAVDMPEMSKTRNMVQSLINNTRGAAQGSHSVAPEARKAIHGMLGEGNQTWYEKLNPQQQSELMNWRRYMLGPSADVVPPVEKLKSIISGGHWGGRSEGDLVNMKQLPMGMRNPLFSRAAGGAAGVGLMSMLGNGIMSHGVDNAMKLR